MSPKYPKTSVVWPGSILGTIVYNTMVAEDIEYDVMQVQGWNGNDYVLNGGDGRYGCISFDDDSFVGLFFDTHSKYNPFPYDEDYDREIFYRGMSSHHRDLAERRASQYLLLDYRGKTTAIISAAFWDNGEFITAVMPWEDILENGASLVENESIENIDDAMIAWQDAYQMNKEQMTFARSLFDRKRSLPRDEDLKLTTQEIKWLQNNSADSESFEKSLERFKDIRIIAPDAHGTP